MRAATGRRTAVLAVSGVLLGGLLGACSGDDESGGDASESEVSIPAESDAAEPDAGDSGAGAPGVTESES